MTRPSPIRLDRRRLATGLALSPLLGITGCATPGSTKPLAQAALRVKVFPGAQNLPLFVAFDQGFFARQRLRVELFFTQNSIELRDGLATGDVQIAHAAVDNAVAMREVAGQDVVIFMGGDDSLNELFVQAGIDSLAAMRGKTLIVDAPDTAYALQARKILLDNGLKAGDYRVKAVGATIQRVKAMREDRENSASTLNPPFSFEAADAGLKSMGRVSTLIGPYQASGGFCLRPWATGSGQVLQRYIRAYVDALRWAMDPAHADRCIALMADKMALDRTLARRTYAAVADPVHGLARDARFDDAGFRNVLALRAELESGDAMPTEARRPDRYVDLSWYKAALRAPPT